MSTPPEPPDPETTPDPQRLHLTLFVGETSPASARTVRRPVRPVRPVRPTRLQGYDLRIVDLYQEPEEVFSRGVLAVPTLFKGLPLPVKMVIGDFTNVPQVLATSGLSTTKDA